MGTIALTSITPGNPLTGFTGRLGFRFQVPAAGYNISALGLQKMSGMTGSINVSILKAGSVVASVAIDVTSASVGTTVWANLASPYAASASDVLGCVADITSGMTYSDDTTSSVTADATVALSVVSAYQPNSTGTLNTNLSNKTFYPTNFDLASHGPSIPNAPTLTDVHAVDTTHMSVTWTYTNTDTITSFDIQYDLSNTFPTPVTTNILFGSTTASIGGLQPNTLYYWRVRANNASGSSAWSNTASATTPAPSSGGSGAALMDVMTGGLLELRLGR